MDPKYIISLSGRDYPTYQGVLSEAHAKGLTGIVTDLVQIPSEENGWTAIVFATVMMEEGKKTFQDYGDASPKNCSARVATALIRMASTRAKGRALRDAVNIGQTMLEELPDTEETRETTPAAPAPHTNGSDGLVPCSHKGCVTRIPKARARHTTESYGAPYCAAHEALLEAAQRGRDEMAKREQTGPPAEVKHDPNTCSAPGCGKALTKGQHDVSMGRFHEPLCPAHQRERASEAAAGVQS